MENRWENTRIIKCQKCKQVFFVDSSLDEKLFKCIYCKTDIENKEYFEPIKKILREVNNG